MHSEGKRVNVYLWSENALEYKCVYIIWAQQLCKCDDSITIWRLTTFNLSVTKVIQLVPVHKEVVFLEIPIIKISLH